MSMTDREHGLTTRRPRRAAGAALAALLVLCSGAAARQPASTGPGVTPGPRPVEQGVGDLNPLQISNRLEPLDLRRPTGWDRVYRLTGDARRDGGRGLFARMDGGIAAVFPWSTYEATPKGVKVPVPAGTTYYIGSLPESISPGSAPMERAEPDRSFNFLDRSAHAGQPGRPLMHAETSMETSARGLVRLGEAAPAASAPSGPTIWTSEVYRRERIEALLSAAAR